MKKKKKLFFKQICMFDLEGHLHHDDVDLYRLSDGELADVHFQFLLDKDEVRVHFPAADDDLPF